MKNKPYPENVCTSCGVKASHGEAFTISTYHWDTCDVCGFFRACTEPRDFYYPTFEGHETFGESNDLNKDQDEAFKYLQELFFNIKEDEKEEKIVKLDKNIRPLIIVGPSGVGKTTLIEALEPYGFRRAQSVTTREPRPEDEGKNIHKFVTEKEFMQMKENGELLEANHFHDAWYGMTINSFKELAKEGYIPVNEVYYETLEDFKKHFHSSFVVALSVAFNEMLVERMMKRGDKYKDIASRLKVALEEKRYLFNNIDLFNCFFDTDDGWTPEKIARRVVTEYIEAGLEGGVDL